jgi:uncharacterized protein (TIGR02996 family)
MNQSEHDALLRAVCESPGDDAPRLVYADWLDDHGRRERAEFIRVQIALAGIDESDERFLALQQREEELLAAHAKAWESEVLGEMDSFAVRNMWQEAVYRRGFPARLYVSNVGAFQRRGGAFLERIPAEEVFLYWTYDDDLKGARWSRLVQEPHGGRLNGLKTSGRGYALASLTRLLTGPLASQITHLDTHDCDYYGRGIAEVLADALTGLRWMDLAGNQMQDEGVAGLAQLSRLAGLRTLLLGVDAGDATNDLTAEGMRALAASPYLNGLEHLDLNSNEIGSDGVIALFASANASSLRELDLSYCRVDDEGAIALARSPYAAGLRRLKLASAALSDEGARALADSPNLSNLVRLDLDGTDYDNDDGEPFITAAGKGRLRERFGCRLFGLRD